MMTRTNEQQIELCRSRESFVQQQSSAHKPDSGTQSLYTPPSSSPKLETQPREPDALRDMIWRSRARLGQQRRIYLRQRANLEDIVANIVRSIDLFVQVSHDLNLKEPQSQLHAVVGLLSQEVQRTKVLEQEVSDLEYLVSIQEDGGLQSLPSKNLKDPAPGHDIYPAGAAPTVTSTTTLLHRHFPLPSLPPSATPPPPPPPPPPPHALSYSKSPLFNTEFDSLSTEMVATQQRIENFRQQLDDLSYEYINDLAFADTNGQDYFKSLEPLPVSHNVLTQQYNDEKAELDHELLEAEEQYYKLQNEWHDCHVGLSSGMVATTQSTQNCNLATTGPSLIMTNSGHASEPLDGDVIVRQEDDYAQQTIFTDRVEEWLATIMNETSLSSNESTADYARLKPPSLNKARRCHSEPLLHRLRHVSTEISER